MERGKFISRLLYGKICYDKTMQKGLLITNAFLRSDKFDELSRLFLEAADRLALSLLPFTNADFLVLYTNDGLHVVPGEKALEALDPLPDFILFWDKDIRLAEAFEQKGIPVFNSSRGILLCDDKSETLKALAGRVKMPASIMAPMTYEKEGCPDLSFLSVVEKKLGYPLIIKECFGSFGAQVHLAHDRDEAEEILHIIHYPFLFQEWIAESAGSDLRLQVVGDRVVAAMRRENRSDFRANLSNGGSMSAWKPSKEEEDLALSACRLLGLDFAGIDILSGKDGPLLCEVNSNAHFKNITDCTGSDVASLILKHCMEKSVGICSEA